MILANKFFYLVPSADQNNSYAQNLLGEINDFPFYLSVLKIN